MFRSIALTLRATRNGTEIALKTGALSPKVQIFWRNVPQLTDNASHMDKIERQREIESNSVRDGCARWCQNTDYQQATDTKPYRNLIGISLRLLADGVPA